MNIFLNISRLIFLREVKIWTRQIYEILCAISFLELKLLFSTYLKQSYTYDSSTVVCNTRALFVYTKGSI